MPICCALIFCVISTFASSGAHAETTPSISEQIYVCSQSAIPEGIISFTKSRRCTNPLEYPSIWHFSEKKQILETNQKELVACTSLNPNLKYLNAKKSCREYQKTNIYYRNATPPNNSPEILQIINIGRYSADLRIKNNYPNTDAPIKYFKVSVISSATNATFTRDIEVDNREDLITVSELSPATKYSFNVAVATIDGVSPISPNSQEIRTLNPPPAAPIFNLSSNVEVGSINNAITGFSVIQNGGPVDRFTIAPEIDPSSGLVFDQTTGTLSGTPVTVIGETIYTITGYNESGSYSETFTLTVNGFPGGPIMQTWIIFIIITFLWFAHLLLRRRGNLQSN